MFENEEKTASVVQPETQYTGRNDQMMMEGQGGYMGHQMEGGAALEPSKPLEVQMIPK